MRRPAHLEPYFGPLSPEDAMKGTELAMLNARQLLGSAQVLFNLAFFPQSTVLAPLAVEEMEKVFILLDILLSETDDQGRQLWLQYRRHSSKHARFTRFLQVKAHVEKNQ